MLKNDIMNSIDDYITEFPKEIQTILEQIRSTIRSIAPEAKETIKYGMPAFELKGVLVYFAAFKKHIGFYPIPTGIETFKEALSIYKQGKGSVQFSLDKPMPLDLIADIVAYRVQENSDKALRKKDV
ncbi:hypothetical protein EZS27_021873 [termite gut metagenome]|uniref:YdhG-like domain-containing protein n=1 Tax=termite gut metagenome TaxID=433724 RepID=A0A5J4R7K9_9ZZZZ